MAFSIMISIVYFRGAAKKAMEKLGTATLVQTFIMFPYAIPTQTMVYIRIN